MRRRGRVVLGFTALALLGAALLLRPMRPDEPPAVAAGTSAAGDPSPAADLPARPAEPPAVAPAPPAPAAARPSPDREYQPQPDSLAEWLQEREPLTARWASETGDPSWNRQATSQIAAILINAQLSPNALRDVDCRQTICRVKLHSDSKVHRDVSALIGASRKLVDQTFLVPFASDQGGWDIETFFPREGWSLEGAPIGKTTEVTQGGV
jgi:hypothetical protein